MCPWNSLQQIDITLPTSTLATVCKEGYNAEILWNYFIANFDPSMLATLSCRLPMLYS